ncbi:MAG: helix-turn-helix transcriptional regulator [Legionella sp.]|uniref:XRE family transcriptional regulator n=1 Tax=Legionella sp. TaxID=459 RepID=UPI0039E62A7D
MAAKLSHKKLGIAAGMDEFSASARMNHYEMARHNPDYATLKRIADILKIPTAYFYAEDDSLAEFIKLFERMDEQEKIILLKDIKGYLT